MCIAIHNICVILRQYDCIFFFLMLNLLISMKLLYMEYITSLGYSMCNKLVKTLFSIVCMPSVHETVKIQRE